MWHRRSVLLLALIALAAPAAAETLRGGSTATLAMSVDRLPRGAEEWEAFLSIDGGAHYAIRITPHLDLKLRHVTWVVPNVDARDARIMIRAGDEREETSFEIPGIFAIARDAAAPPPPMRAAPPTRAEAGVVAWAEGDRAGTRVALATNVPPPSGMDSVRRGTPADDAPVDSKLRVARCALRVIQTQPLTPQPNLPTAQHPNPKNLLLLSRRLNV
jgi:hypothetical protein